MGIFAQCLRKEKLIERFKIRDLVRETSEMTHRNIFCRKKKEKRSEGEIRKRLSKMTDLSCSGARKGHFVTCATREDVPFGSSNISRHLKILF